MNRTEQNFAEFLNEHLLAEEHLEGLLPEPFTVIPFRWKFEAINLTLADNTQYRPDFYVVTTQGQGIFFEVKARTFAGKVLWQDASRVKFKVAADLYPEFRFICASYNTKSGWEFEEIAP